MKIQIDGAAGELVDLSVGGAQVLCPRKPEANHVAAVSLLAGESSLDCRGKIVWAWLEPHSQRRALRYRAGIMFTEVDEAAIDAFISRHAAK